MNVASMQNIFIIAILSGLPLAMQGHAKTSGNKKTNIESYNQMADQLNVIDLEKENVENLEEFFYPKQRSNEVYIPKHHTKEILTKIFLAQIPKSSKPVHTNPHILKDTKVLPENYELYSSMLHELFQSTTFSGEVFRQLVLKHWPTFDRNEVEHRQKIIEKNILIPDQALTNIENKLKELKRFEALGATLFDTDDFVYSTEVQELITDNIGYQQKKASNLIWSAATTIKDCAVSILDLSTTCALIYPLFINTNRGCCGCLAYSSMLTVKLVASYIYHKTVSMVKEAERKTSLYVYRGIRFRTDTFSKLLKTALQLNDIIEIPEELKLKLTDEERVSIESFISNSDYLISADPKTKKYYLTESIRLLSTAIDLKSIIARILYQAGQLDLYTAIAKRMKCTECEGVNFVHFVQGESYINAKGIWNPMIEGAIPNDIEMGSPPDHNKFINNLKKICPAGLEPLPRNLIISGGNASGKSTFMRAVMVNSIFLSQIFGIAAAESLETNLFHTAYSYMDKVDIPGHLSSYEAELDNAFTVLDQLKSLPPGENSLACFDELFSTTAPADGLIASKVVLQALAEYQNSIFLISTHYDFGDFFQARSFDFSEKHMHIDERNGTLTFTYKFKDGANKIKNAHKIFNN